MWKNQTLIGVLWIIATAANTDQMDLDATSSQPHPTSLAPHQTPEEVNTIVTAPTLIAGEVRVPATTADEDALSRKRPHEETVSDTHEPLIPSKHFKTSSSTDDNNGTISSNPDKLQDISSLHQPVRGGAPTRRYLNELVTPALLDGMKLIAREQPDNPLEKLALYLLDRSKKSKMATVS
ncbi:uncharacterized protein V2V93DRAFT_373610 [Kockiozyma suomiensis]|uniref:uncharacterized protein n=1 Tax=Kockiozyma suomiensis TaxID=1337062 RepID=UPI00334405A8